MKTGDVCGVYVIRQIGTDRCYVGSSFGIAARWRDHRSALHRGSHHSRFLQRAWRKYGAAAFEWLVIEELDRPTLEVLLAREQHYIDSLDSCFNGRPGAGTFLGAKHRPETLAVLRQRARERMDNPSPAFRAYWASMQGQARGDYPAEWGAAISRAKKGKTKGQPWSAARRAALELRRQIGPSPKQSALYAARKGRRHTDEERAKIGAGVRRYLSEHDDMGAVHITRSTSVAPPVAAVNDDEASATA